MTLWPSTYANLPQQGAPNENAAGSRAAVVISRACHKFPDVNNLTRYSVHAKRSNQTCFELCARKEIQPESRRV
jgi:hypothetical protein